jgi:hypothetical protein
MNLENKIPKCKLNSTGKEWDAVERFCDLAIELSNCVNEGNFLVN